MEIKGIGEKYLDGTGMTVEEIANGILEYMWGETRIDVIHVLAAGWDAWFGKYAVVEAKRKKWVVSKGKVTRYDSFARYRGLY